MRSFAALAVHVFLFSSAFARASDAQANSWFGVHQKGIEAAKVRDFERAADWFRQSLEFAHTQVEKGLSTNDLGVTLHQLVRNAEAKPHLENAFRIWQANPGQEERMALTAEGLAAVYRSLGEYQAAESTLRTALRTPPLRSDSHALLLNELGDVLREVGQTLEARRLLEKTLALTEVSPRRRVDAMIGLADLNREARNWEASFEGWSQSAEMARDHQWVGLEAAATRGMGQTLLEHGEPARAEPLLRRSLALFESQDVPRNQISSTLTCLAQLYLTEGKYGMAEEVLQRALNEGERHIGGSHPQVAVILEMLGDAVAGRKQLDVAHVYYQRARAIMAARFGDESPMVAAVDASWAVTEERGNRKVEAIADYEKALAILNTAGPDVESLRQRVAKHYAQLCKALHRKTPVTTNTFLPLPNRDKMPQSK